MLKKKTWIMGLIFILSLLVFHPHSKGHLTMPVFADHPKTENESETMDLSYELSGLVNDGNALYYYENGEKVKSRLITLVDPDGKKEIYYFTSSGKAFTKGYKKISDKKGNVSYYYFRSSGKAFTSGLKKVTIDGKTYTFYFKSNGKAFTDGYKAVKDRKGVKRYYYFRSNGKAFTDGFKKVKIKDKYYYFYFRESGCASVNSFKQAKVNGKKYYYYFQNNGRAVVYDFRTIGKSTYYFGEYGRAARGFTKIDGNTYYFNNDPDRTPYMFTGKHTISHYYCKFNKNGILKRKIDTNKKLVCVTYDDGPSANTATILDTLKENGGVATFFLVGERVAEFSKMVEREYKEGSEVANHTFNHKILTKISSDEIKSQLKKTDDAVEKLIGVRTKVMRPPGGGQNAAVKAAVDKPLILWSIDTLDWKTKNADSTISTIKKEVKDGSVILMHDLYEPTARASKTIIPWLVNNGYELVTVSEMGEIRGGLEKGVSVGSFYK